MVYFRSKNFGIMDFSRECFQTVYQNKHGIDSLYITKIGVLLASEQKAIIVKNESEEQETKIVGKFDRNVTCVATDGDLIACGDESGQVRVVINRRNTLRRYCEHTARINELKVNERMVISCSDDMTVKVFDIGKQESVWTVSDSNDYVKGIDVMDGVLYSGSYDGHVNGYILDRQERVFSYDSRCKVSKVCGLGGFRVAFSCLNEVRVIEANDCGEVEEIGKSMHIKEVTGMKYYEGRLYTSSLDASIRVFTKDLVMISKVRTRYGILSLNILDGVLWIGLVDGQIQKLQKEKEQVKKRRKVYKKSVDDLEDEIDVEVVKSLKKKYDAVEGKLNRYEYKRSMMGAIRKRDMQEIFAVMSYIQEKREFEHAFLDLDRGALGEVIDAMTEFFSIKEFIPIFIECFEEICSQYERDICDDRRLSSKMEVLAGVIDEEIFFQEENLRTISLLECFQADVC
ncbi:hypothetical protein CWI42_121050 [Ordospora colligata]|uniref:U3 small nucleolar RNA-associated protein 15 C-terminal domain-containing protein n=1 Tax=Ordospora colligata OC4 TaxID=1354746 RepID=A0A0B2UHS2_9MICR|nr:uncharacterized protein M896_121050 [Ordospora colligata OC4]KHN68883.1 hypothetical protein M896_121050 [Ordospora colligata OC4]TBU13917.1 hypothetical protein CWI40_121050 [Ordospora colligata]TBU14106.1 hypothetical protein CWI41_121050 [Ordospora colligata]TBU17775.1 hypothetical protein CWI42_121050 [Ordospora colligata]